MTVWGQEALRYRSYLLRFWEERSAATGSAIWRFSLDNPRTGERHGFATLAALIAFLEGEVALDLLPPDGVLE